MMAALFFILAFATLAALVWSGIELFTVKEAPLDDRLEELQAHALVSTERGPRRRGGGGFHIESRADYGDSGRKESGFPANNSCQFCGDGAK